METFLRYSHLACCLNVIATNITKDKFDGIFAMSTTLAIAIIVAHATVCLIADFIFEHLYKAKLLRIGLVTGGEAREARILAVASSMAVGLEFGAAYGLVIALAEVIRLSSMNSMAHKAGMIKGD